MNLQTFLTTWRGTRLENKYQRWVIAGLVVSNVIVGLAAFARGETVVVIPPDLAGKVAISKSDSDRDYQQAWAFFLAQLLGNVTPGNADIVKKVIEPLLAPAIYRETVRVLAEQVESIKRDRVSLRFEPREIKFEQPTGKAFIEGFSVVSGAAGKEERNPRTYEFVIKVRNYRPVIEHIDNYIGPARTISELERQERAEESKQRVEQRRVEATDTSNTHDKTEEAKP